MAAAVSDGFLDGGLDAIDGSTAINICTTAPTSVAECDSLSLIPAHTLTGGDFAKSDAAGGGRKLTIAEQPGLTADAAGDAEHIAINDGTDFYVTTCTLKTLAVSDTVTIPSWTITFGDPTAS